MADMLLGAIANPQIADIGAALDIRQKRYDEDEARRKKIRTGQLIAEAVPGLRENSPLHQLAHEDPEKFVFIAKAMGVPLNSGDQLQAVADDAHVVANIAKDDPQGAIQYVDNLIAQRQKMGLDTTKWSQWSEAAKQDPDRGARIVDMMDKTFNSDVYRKREIEDRKLAQEDRALDIQEQRINTDRSTNAQGTADQKNWAQYQELLKTDPAAAEQFARATGFVTNEGQKLSGLAEKTIVEASDAASSAANSANKYKALASKLETAALNSGVKGTWGEFIKEQTGNQDELTALRKEALSISNSEAIKNLPPGPATDKDIEIAQAPFPTEKADPKYVAKWLASVARLREKEAEFNDFKADFVSKHGTVRTKDGESLASAWKKSQKEKQPTENTATTSTQETAAQRLARLMKNGN